MAGAALSLPSRVPPSRVLLVASLGAFVAFLDVTVVNVAFPSIAASFPQSSIGSLSWVLNAYNVVFAGTLIVAGRIADLVGRRRSFMAGIALFTIASLLCGAAPSLGVLIAARVVQALGAALLVPSSLGLVVGGFSEDRRAHAIGLWGATAALAAGLGPPLGGVLVELLDWRWAFYVNLPIGAATWFAARRVLVESRAPGRRRAPDLGGAALLSAALGLLSLALVQSPDWGWLSVGVLGAAAGALALLSAFVLRSRRHPSPLLDPDLLRLPSFVWGNAGTVVAGLGFYAYLLCNVLWLQGVWGYSVIASGLALVPGPVIALVAAARLGPLAAKLGYRVIVVPGALAWAAAYLWYHWRATAEPQFLSVWLPGQILSGLGAGAVLPLLGSAALAAVPRGRYATASAVASSSRQVGGVLGVALLLSIVGASGAVQAGDHRTGWLLSVAAFLVVAVLVLPLGKVPAADERAPDAAEEPVLFLPPPVETLPGAGERGPLLAGLEEGAIRALEESGDVVTVHAGDWVMREGDPPGPAYLVRRGRLEVLVDGVRVRELGPGAVIGDLALLTGSPRSASIRVRRDAELLEITAETFDALIDADSAARRAVLQQLAHRLRTAGGGEASAPTQPRVVAVVAGSASVTPDDVTAAAATLTARLATHRRVLSLGRVDADGLARAEQDAERVVLCAGPLADEDAAWRAFCLRQSDVVVLVVRAADPPVEPPVAPAAQPELVVLGDAPESQQIAAWVAATDAWHATAAPSAGDAAALRSLADRLAGRSLGVVFSGGGARALAHVGVLLELEEAGVIVDRVAGTSQGAIVAALHAQGRPATEIADVLYAGFVRRSPFADWTFPVTALLKGRAAQAMMDEGFADARIEALPRQLRVVSVDLAARRRHVHRRGPLSRAVLASGRLPIAFPPLPGDDGTLLIDGGVLDNLPVDLLLERPEGPVVAVNISTGGRPRRGGARRTGPPPVPSLGETLIRTMTISDAGAVRAATERGVPVVTPATLGVGLLEYHQIDAMLDAGRAAGRVLVEQVLSGEGDSSATVRRQPAAEPVA